MKEYIELGPVPCDEEASQTNECDFYERNIAECRRYKELLTEKFSEHKEAECFFIIKSSPHDFGKYSEVAISFETKNPISLSFAFKVEENLPGKWSETNKIKLLDEAKEEAKKIEEEEKANANFDRQVRLSMEKILATGN